MIYCNLLDCLLRSYMSLTALQIACKLLSYTAKPHAKLCESWGNPDPDGPLSSNIPSSSRAGRTGPADPATAGPILTKYPIATHNHDLRQTLSRAICNFRHLFCPITLLPSIKFPFSSLCNYKRH